MTQRGATQGRSLGAEPIAELLPQRGGMCLLEAVILHEPDRTVCRVDPRQSGLFEDAAGRVPCWLALEYMAQCATAHGALVSRAGLSPRPEGALLLGVRQLELHRPWLPPGVLEVEALCRGSARGLVSFDCALRDPAAGDPLATGRLSVYTLGGAAVGVPSGDA